MNLDVCDWYQCCIVFPLKKLLVLVFTLQKLFGSSPSEDLSLFFPNYKPFNFNFNTFDQIQEPLDLVQKPDLDLCTHYTLLNVRNCTSTEFYKKLKHGSL
jgi:hypothetical protein